MFDPASPAPRVFGLPPGVDFAAELAAGLRARLDGQPPEAIARVTVFVNAGRMARRLHGAFTGGPAGFLPRIRLVTDLADAVTHADLPAPVPPLRRRLELTGLVARLLDAQPDLAPRAALYDLADSLARVLAEMQTEGMPPDRLSTLDVADQSGHWQRALQFLHIVQDVARTDAPDEAGHARLALQTLLARWRAAPPADPVIVAGSTGSRGATHELMAAVARLPQGALVLPGFDTHLPAAVWDRLDAALTGEDHPQYRFARLLGDLSLRPADVAPWTATQAPSPARNAVLSLALRPAPVTHQWLRDGPALPDLPEALAGVTLLEAPSPREEARAIATRLRAAVARGESAALVTPDRMLTRQVTAALDRWNIHPDDSAGVPAQLTPPGRFLRHTAALFQRPLTAEALLTLLKHPLCHSGADRGPHLLATRELELHARRHGWPFPQPDAIRAWGEATGRADWAAWVADTLCDRTDPGPRPLADRVAAHTALAERLAAGAGQDGAGALWDGEAGRLVRGVVDDLGAEAEHGSDLDPHDYADLFGAVLAGAMLTETTPSHPDIRIWGTQEVRPMGADLLILAGLNDGTWPEAPQPDPWLNRALRLQAGLLLPDRQIGLSAHDFQIGFGAAEVWLSRAVKSEDAETVPSRWLNRLGNLVRGLPQRNGPQALAQMRARGEAWLALGRATETPIRSDPAPRPSPAPPVAARPRELAVTRIKTLIRDPYAIYARYVLRLRPLDPLMPEPDALMRGVLMHKVVERAVRRATAEGRATDAAVLMDEAQTILSDPARVPFPTMRLLWPARLARVAQWFETSEAARLARATPELFEKTGKLALAGQDFTLTATADRIDVTPDGRAAVYDYKTGAIPTDKAQRAFDKQLLLEAAMIERGGFPDLGPVGVAVAAFIGLSPSAMKEAPAPLIDAPPDQIWTEFGRLIAAYADPDKGYTARRAMLLDSDVSDYDHLARRGEWDLTDAAVRIALP